MSARSNARPVISISPLYSIAFNSLDNSAIFLDVRFKCDFAENAKPVKGTSISIDPGKLHSVVQIAEGAYSAICELLQAQQRKAMVRK
jgi:hypothetical protein